jgi:predicted transcriptional regulator
MSNLTSQQLQAVSLLASGKSKVEVASMLGISTKTVQRWTKIPEFTQAVTDVHSRSVQKVVEKTSEDISRQSQEVIQRLVPKALMVIHEYLTDPSAKASDRLKACHIIGSWAGLNQAQVHREQPAEQNLKDYLSYLAANKNGASGNASN